MILIVGGAGYIGSHVNKILHQDSIETVVFDNLTNGHKYLVKWGKFFKGDLKNIDEIRQVFEENNIEAVMHFAAHAYVGESMIDPQKYYINNVSSTINLLKVMMEKKCKIIIFSSTCAVYGNPRVNPISEEEDLFPINPYGKSKLFVETILEDYRKAYGLEYISLRYFNASGADFDLEIGENHKPETHLIPLILDVAASKREYIKVFGNNYNTKDGTAVRDYIHVLDIANAHLISLKYLQSEKKSEIFNLGNGGGSSVLEVINSAKRVTGKNINYKIYPRRDGDPDILVGDFTKIQKILDWKPKHKNIDVIVKSAWEYYKTINIPNKI